MVARAGPQKRRRMGPCPFSRKQRRIADWTSLPDHLVEDIANWLGAIEDFICLRAVCKSWRSAVSIHRWKPNVPRMPWLMLRSNTDWRASFYSLETGKYFEMKLPAASRRLGCQNGWIFNVGLDHLESYLLNPITGFEISLPSLTTLNPPYTEPDPDYFEREVTTLFGDKVFVFEKPKPAHYGDDGATEAEILVVALIFYDYKIYQGQPGYVHRVAIWRSGYKFWVLLEQEDFRDLVCYQGRVYLARWEGNLDVLCDSDGPVNLSSAAPEYLLKVPRQVVIDGGKGYTYIVESGEDLLMVNRIRVPFKGDEEFEIYKFDFEKKIWNQIKDLAGCTLFVGYNYSLSVGSKANNLTCMANCIFCDYSTKFNWYARQRVQDKGFSNLMSIFDMEANTFEVYTGESSLFEDQDRLSFVSPSTWMMPSFGWAFL